MYGFFRKRFLFERRNVYLFVLKRNRFRNLGEFYTGIKVGDHPDWTNLFLN